MVTTADQNTVRQHNTALIIENLRARQPISRAQLAVMVGLNRSTVSSIINQLLEENAIEETILQSDRVGRPGMLLRLNPFYGFAVGIDLNVDALRAAVVDFDYNIIWEEKIPSSPALGKDAILQTAIKLTEKALQAGADLNMKPIGIGIGAPGLFDVHRGLLMTAPNLGWENTPIKDLWEAHFNLPVFVENEANAAALAEYYLGAAENAAHFILINGGVGIGGGIMIDGELLRGAHGYASEVGHMVIEPQGKPCKCGSRGCAETIIGKTAIEENIQKRIEQGAITSLTQLNLAPSQLTIDEIAAAAIQGDQLSLDEVYQVSQTLGIVVSNLINVLNPQMVVLGGFYNAIADIILPLVTKVAKTHAMHPSRENVEITMSKFGNNATAIGTAILVYDHLLKPSFLHIKKE